MVIQFISTLSCSTFRKQAKNMFTTPTLSIFNAFAYYDMLCTITKFVGFHLRVSSEDVQIIEESFYSTLSHAQYSAYNVMDI